MARERVVITGIGLVTPLGLDTISSWQAIKDGEIGIKPLSKVHLDDVDVSVAAEIRNFDPLVHFSKKECRRMDLVTQYGVVAAREAIQSAKLKSSDYQSERAGVIVGTGIGGLSTIEKEHSTGLNRGFSRISPFFIPLSIANITAGSIAMDSQFHGVCTAVVTACAAATNSIGEAFHKIRDGYLDLALAGGSEASITELGIGGFAALRALSTNSDTQTASRPFDQERDGFVMGEGAGILLLESLSSARRRQAEIIAEVVGYGASCDAFHMTAPDPEAKGATLCLQLCLADAQISPADVQYINAHGTSTPLNDSAETLAIKQTFAEQASKLKISSTKSQIGHLLGASGGVEAAVTALAIRDQFAPPTMGLKKPSEDCDLDYLAGAGEPLDIDYAVSNSLGFGGHNASLAFARFKD
ncbi:MAG: beta-ketoacyl-ACP synthase II [Eubacteriales bacterium]|nr:beta-ketoacyl-ACP synthase II [Eubacteriales bacterium]